MTGNLASQRINTYFALLILTVFGAGASMLIIHVATETSYANLGIGGAQYAQALLQ